MSSVTKDMDVCTLGSLHSLSVSYYNREASHSMKRTRELGTNIHTRYVPIEHICSVSHCPWNANNTSHILYFLEYSSYKQEFETTSCVL